MRCVCVLCAESAVRLLLTRDMLLLCVVFAYSGFVVTFYSSVYPTSVGHVHEFGSYAKAYIGLAGVFIGTTTARTFRSKLQLMFTTSTSGLEC